MEGGWGGDPEYGLAGLDGGVENELSQFAEPDSMLEDSLFEKEFEAMMQVCAEIRTGGEG